MFQVTTLDLASLGRGIARQRRRSGPLTGHGARIDYANDFFGKRASLTVSGQLEAEIFATSLGCCYTFGPTFRAENSNTTRHLSEFWMVEPEMPFCFELRRTTCSWRKISSSPLKATSSNTARRTSPFSTSDPSRLVLAANLQNIAAENGSFDCPAPRRSTS